METHDVGEAVPIISYWWDQNDEGAEPTSIDLTIEVPDGSTLTATKADMADVSDPNPQNDTWQYMLTGTIEGAYVWQIEGVVDGRTLKSSGVILFGPASASPGPCGLWCDWQDVLDTCPDVEELADETLLPQGARNAILERVTWILYMLDGGRYPGICTTTRSLCRGCRRVGGRCCCAEGDRIDMRGRFPIFDVWDVTIDDEIIDRSLYTVRDSRYLVRTDDEYWPACNDWSATWAFGRNPPVGLRHAAAVFAREIGKACVGVDCALPERVTSVSREGVSYVLLDSQKFLDEGRTGIYDVDLALIAARPPQESGRSFPGGGSPLRRTTSHRPV